MFSAAKRGGADALRVASRYERSCNLRVEVEVELEVAVLRDKVNLGEHVDVRELELEHRAQ